MMKKFLHCPATRHAGLSGSLRALLVCMAALALTSAAAYGSSDTVPQQQAKISLDMKNSSMVDIINAIRNISDYRFLYSVNELDRYGMRDFRVVDAALSELMDELLRGTDLSYEIENGVVMITPGPQQPQPNARAQQPQTVTVAGSVKDQRGMPVIGATVVVKGTTRGTATDAGGNFRFTTPRIPDMVVVFSYVGMKTLEVAYTGQASIDVTMEADTQAIDQVVVTGIFLRDKVTFTGSETTLNSDDIRALSSDNVLTALAIADPSFRMDISNLAGSNPSAVANYTLRGGANMGSYTTDDAVVLRGDYADRPNQPLFVLDGIIDVDVTAITDLDPEQVESITLLKDASATVIYGSKAANGVVVVETKSPVAGKLRVTYNGNYGIQMPDLSDYNLTNSREKLEIEERAGYFNGNNIENLAYYAALKLEVERGVDTDWLVIPVRNAFTHRHALNFEGGSDNLRYKVYLGASFTPGVMKNTDMNTQNGRVDIHYRTRDFQIINQTHLDYGKGRRESDYGTFDLYARINPYYRAYDENGNIKKVLDPNTSLSGWWYGTPTYNPLWNTLFDSRNETKDFTMKESIRMEYTGIENLRLEASFNMNKTFQRTDVFKSSNHTESAYAVTPSDKGSYLYTNNENNSWRVDLTASYGKLFGDDHQLNLFFRATMGESDSYGSTLGMTGFPNDRLSEVFMGTTFRSISGVESISRDLGFVFSGSYSFRQKYVADLSARIDASTKFGRNNRYAPFWSIGGRWNIHKENIFENSALVDQLVLRATYGITGSDKDFSSWQALQMYTYQSSMSTYVSSDVVGALLLGMGNPDLKWQQTDNYNAAIDFTLFKGILSGTFEYYYKYTKNTLIDYSLAPSTGFTSVKENLGHISNRGFEFSLRVTPWRDDSRQAYWNIGVNGAQNRSRIEKISEALALRNQEIYADTDADLTKPLPQYVNGESMTGIWGMKSMGIDPQTGEEVFLARDGSLTTEWNVKNVTRIGDTAAKLSGTVNSSFGYRNFSVTIAGSYKLGGDVYNSTLADKIENADLHNNVDKRVLTERWEKPGDVAKYKRINGMVEAEQRTNTTSRFVMRENVFQMASINLQYRMNANDHSFIQKLNISSASVGFYFTDIFRFSTIQRERGIYYPFAHQMSMSLNIVF